MDRWNALSCLAKTQMGLITTWQALQLGIRRQVLADRATRHGWSRVVHGVYLLPGCQLTPSVSIRARQLALRDTVVAVGQSGAFVYGLRSRPGRPIQLGTAPGSRLHVQGARIRQHRWLPAEPRVLHAGIWVPSAARVIATMAAHADVTGLVEAMSTAHRRRLTTPSSVLALVEADPRMAGRGRLRAALGELEGALSHSGLERTARVTVVDAGFHPHPRPFAVVGPRGLIAELDIAWPDDLVGICVDGPHHLLPDQRRYDEDQRLELRALGWTILWVDEHRLLHQPTVFLRQLRDALDHARRLQPQ